MQFKDHFSQQSAAYSRYRPGYPQALIDFVAQAAGRCELAIDCATGNGQAAVALAGAFAAVLAVDGSASQLRRAVPHPRVQYACALAEALPVADHSADLIAAAQAVHWFDFERYYAECRRVLRPGGLFAAWTYEKFRVDDRVDALVDAFYTDVVGRYWPPERRYVEQGYRTLPFPWEELSAPPFTLQTDWTLAEVIGYLATWSSVQRYKDAHAGADPLPQLQSSLAPLWPADGSPRRIAWPIHVRLGRA